MTTPVTSIVDTNVVLVANGQHQGVSPGCVAVCSLRLQAIMQQERKALGEHLILFGEWCAARHSLEYDRLADWLLAFDVYDRQAQLFWSSSRRNALADQLGLKVVPKVFSGKATLESLKELLQKHPSAFRKGPMEGVVVRHESENWLEERAKLVRSDFTQAIGEHWRNRKIEWNRLDWSQS